MPAIVFDERKGKGWGWGWGLALIPAGSESVVFN